MADEKKITHPPILLPICIYHKDGPLGGEQGYLGVPTMNMDSEGNLTLVCYKEKPAYEGWYNAGRFFGVNPMYTSIPSDMTLICAKRSETAEHSYDTISVSTVYDPFNDDQNCVYFMGWTRPVPYTTPLYLYEGTGGGIFPTFERKNGLPEGYRLTILYVLTDEPMEGTIFPGEKKWFSKWKDGTPNFFFKNYMGRCIPDPDGITFEECTLKNDTELLRPISLLDYLNEKAKKENKARFAESVPQFFKKVNVVWVSIVLGIFLLALAAVLYWVFKNKNDSGGGNRYGR